MSIFHVISGITGLGHTIVDLDEEADCMLHLKAVWYLLVKIVFCLWTMLLFRFLQCGLNKILSRTSTTCWKVISTWRGQFGLPKLSKLDWFLIFVQIRWNRAGMSFWWATSTIMSLITFSSTSV